MESLEEQLIRVPWQIIYDVCVAFHLSKAQFDELTWDRFVTLYRLIARDNLWLLN